jgi:hypothetical protein
MDASWKDLKILVEWFGPKIFISKPPEGVPPDN